MGRRRAGLVDAGVPAGRGSQRRRISQAPARRKCFHAVRTKASLTVSIGVATWMPGDSYADVFSRADNALYRSKEAGRNACSVDGVADPSARPLLAGEPPGADRPRGWS
jgi:hypothetical protein